MILEKLRFKKFGISFKRSQNNQLEKTIVFPERTGIYEPVGKIKSSIYPDPADFNEKAEHIHKQLKA